MSPFCGANNDWFTVGGLRKILYTLYSKLNINGNNIERATNFNFLSFTLSSTLSWKHHIDKISLKISKSISILYRLRDIYPRAALQNLYNALIMPQLRYVADATQTIYPVPEANKHTVTTVQYYFNYTALNCITLSCIYTTAGHVHCTAYILA